MKVGISLVTIGVTGTVAYFVVIPWGKRLYAQHKAKKAGENTEGGGANQRTDGSQQPTPVATGPQVGGPRPGVNPQIKIGTPRGGT